METEAADGSTDTEHTPLTNPSGGGKAPDAEQDGGPAGWARKIAEFVSGGKNKVH